MKNTFITLRYVYREIVYNNPEFLSDAIQAMCNLSERFYLVNEFL